VRGTVPQRPGYVKRSPGVAVRLPAVGPGGPREQARRIPDLAARGASPV